MGQSSAREREGERERERALGMGEISVCSCSNWSSGSLLPLRQSLNLLNLNFNRNCSAFIQPKLWLRVMARPTGTRPKIELVKCGHRELVAIHVGALARSHSYDLCRLRWLYGQMGAQADLYNLFRYEPLASSRVIRRLLHDTVRNLFIWRSEHSKDSKNTILRIA